MDGLLACLSVIALWRVAGGAVLGIALAALLRYAGLGSDAWFFVLAFLGASVGVVVHARVITRRSPKRDEPAISKVGGFLGLAAIGGLCGHLVQQISGSAVLAAAVTPCAAIALYGLGMALTGRRLALAEALGWVVAFAVGHATPGLLAWSLSRLLQ